MCYSGKCIYEDYMGDCTAPTKIKNPCKKGRRIGKIEIIKLKFKGFILKIRYRLIKKYRDEIDNLPF